jgi:hypothetical protein
MQVYTKPVNCGICGARLYAPGAHNTWNYEYFCRDPRQCRDNVNAKRREEALQQTLRSGFTVGDGSWAR